MASDHKAADILILDIRACSPLADYFVILSGTSQRQIKALTAELAENLAKERGRPPQIEGASDSGWVLLDYGEVIVHIFVPAERQYYALEKLWGAAVPVLRMQ